MDRLDTSEELGRLERFYDIIDCTGPEARKPVFKRSASCEKQDRCWKRPLLRQLSTEVYPVSIGKLHIQYDHIRCSHRERLASILQRVGEIDAQVARLEVLREAGRYIDIVLYK